MALAEIGSVAPPFTLNNHYGSAVSLADFAGQRVLLWFFPRAFGNN
jgi:peroxiredoxin Q/BCP